MQNPELGLKCADNIYDSCHCFSAALIGCKSKKGYWVIKVWMKTHRKLLNGTRRIE